MALSFPFSFCARMRANNGGELGVRGEPWWLIPFRDTTDRKRLARTASHIEYETKKAREWEHFPSDGVTIAANGAEDYLIFRREPDDARRLSPEVHVWRHEEDEITKIADDFDELLPQNDDT